jgi:hypothetical protein
MNTIVRRSRRSPWIALLLILVATGAAIVWVTYAASASSPQSRASQAALAYAGRYMTWSRGPHVDSVHIVPLRRLSAILATAATPTLRKDVNVGELVRRYGLNSRVALVILSGTYYSLPPDEGVYVTGEAAVLMRAGSDRVILLTN